MDNFIDDSDYVYRLNRLLLSVEQANRQSLTSASELIYQSLCQQGILHVFATGHSHMIADELFYRCGGLVPVSPILTDEMMIYNGANASTIFERTSGNAMRILSKFQLRAQDCLLVCSNSGINPTPIEAVLFAKHLGLHTIGITSVESSRKLTSRHPDNKKLYEVCDIVLDNCVPYGDGLFRLTDQDGVTGGASTFSSLFLGQRLILKVYNRFMQNKKELPIFKSANLHGTDDWNKKMMSLYRERIPAFRA